MHYLLVALFVLGPFLYAAAFPHAGKADSCEDATAGQFSVCAEDSEAVGSGGSSGSGAPAMRECRYFANGTIDVPTMTIITAWVPVGSRPCIGDEVAEPSSTSGHWQTQTVVELRDKFTALATRPMASWNPSGEVEFLDVIGLKVRAETEVVSGNLLGKPAQIRFRPVSSRWELSNGDVLYGFNKNHSFDSPGTYLAQAQVKYEVDYKYASSDWVFEAAQWELGSNKLTIPVIERKRVTLLVG